MNAIGLYRVGNWFYRKKIPLIHRVTFYLTFLLFNSIIPPSCKIGKKSRFAYGGIGVVLHRKCVIGKNCLIGQNVTIGGKSGPNGGGPPIIGDNCYIAAGARVIGDVEIKNNCVIGANAVVVKSIHSNCIAAGVPAKVIKTNIDIKLYWDDVE